MGAEIFLKIGCQLSVYDWGDILGTGKFFSPKR